MNNRAGTPAATSDLIDIAELIDAYYHRVPDVSIASQRVAFDTSGHRGSSLDTAFNAAHIAAITQAIVDYREGQGTTGPLFIGADTHALSAPAQTTALTVLVGNRVDVLVDEFGDWVPTPALSHAITAHNASPGGKRNRKATGSSSPRATTRPAMVVSSTTRRTAVRPTAT